MLQRNGGRAHSVWQQLALKLHINSTFSEDSIHIRVNSSGYLEPFSNNAPPANNARQDLELLQGLFSDPIPMEKPYLKQMSRSSRDDKAETYLALVMLHYFYLFLNSVMLCLFADVMKIIYPQ